MEYNVLFCFDQWMKRNNKVVIQYSVDSPLNSLHEININILTKIHVYILYDIWTEKNPNKNKNKSPGKVYILSKIFLIVKTGFNCVIFFKIRIRFLLLMTLYALCELNLKYYSHVYYLYIYIYFIIILGLAILGHS